jgi:hypothetical protein
MPQQIQWQRQIRLAQCMLLATVVMTVVNVALLLGGGSIHIPYCASFPYYLVWLGKAFDNDLTVFGPVISSFTYTGMVLCAGVLVAWLAAWGLSLRFRSWLMVGMGLVIADTALLLVLSLTILGNFLSSLLELAIHGIVIWEIWRGIRAQRLLQEEKQKACRLQEVAAEE